MSRPKLIRGDLYWSTWVDTDEQKVMFQEYVCRTVNRNGYYLTMKTAFTFGKLSKRHGHYGFFPNTPRWCVDHLTHDQMRRYGHTYGLTKVGAVVAEMAELRRMLKTAKKDGQIFIVEECEAELAVFKAWLKRNRNR